MEFNHTFVFLLIFQKYYIFVTIFCPFSFKFTNKDCFSKHLVVTNREEVVESGNLTYGIRTYSFWPFDFNQGYFNQFEVLESQKWPLVDKIKSFYIKSALSFSDFQLLYGQKTVYSLQPLLFLEIIALNLRLCISFSVVVTQDQIGFKITQKMKQWIPSMLQMTKMSVNRSQRFSS